MEEQAWSSEEKKKQSFTIHQIYLVEGECEIWMESVDARWAHLRDGQHVAVDDLSDFLVTKNKRETDELK